VVCAENSIITGVGHCLNVFFISLLLPSHMLILHWGHAEVSYCKVAQKHV